ncbi:MAG TPA: hypothetical protein VLE47_03935 [Candidatus Saccharimonadales bacterium]|nr:hypothetical protein [Candidatus Saccharimonadales bacterium]
MPEEPQKKSSKTIYFVLGLIVLLVLVAAAGYYFLVYNKTTATTTSVTKTSTTSATVKKTTFTKVSSPKKVFTGGYADPSILKQTDGTYLLYLNKFGNAGNGYFVSSSPDAETWTAKTAVIFTGISVGRAYKTDTGIRFYYPEQMPLIGSTGPMPKLLSANSTDGLKFTTDPGTRITPRDGFFIGGSTVFKLSDGTYRMYFEEPDGADPTKRKGGIWGASSTDGLTWTRDAKITIEDTEDSADSASKWPQALHPYVITKPDGTYIMFYNTHSEIYAAESKDGTTWTKLGKLDIHGADSDGVYLPDGTFRLYYGDFSEQESGQVYFIDLKIS